MFCFQCQETARNTGCTVKGVCGKPEETADLQDLLIYVCKGISVYGFACMRHPFSSCQVYRSVLE